MPTDLHESMRQIIDKFLAGEATAQEQQSLRQHLHACEPCQKYANDGRRAVIGLGGFSFTPSPGLTEKVHASLALRAQQLQAAQPNRQRILQASIAALLLTIVGTFGAMHIGSPLATFLHLPRSQAQVGLFTFWIAPSWCFSLVLPVLLLLRARSTNAKGSVL